MPCEECVKLMKAIGIKYCWYSTGNGEEIIKQKVDEIPVHVSLGNRLLKQMGYN